MAMASSSLTFLLFTLFFASISSIKATVTGLNKSIILPITKDSTTHQHYTTINIGTPSYTFNATIDIAAPILLFNCDASNNKSSTYRPVECQTSECKDVDYSSDGEGNYCIRCHGTPRLGCDQNACTIPSVIGGGDVWRDTITIEARQYSTVVPNFLFSCVPYFNFDGLAAGAQGILGLGWTRSSSMPVQISSTFNVPPRFALCAPSSDKSGRSGAIVFGANSYYMTPYPNNLRQLLNWTYLSYHVNDPYKNVPAEYSIGVNSIKIDGKPVPYRYTSGKASISTTTPYTTLRSDIYKAVVKEFLKSAESKNISRVAPVAPFSECFNGETIRHSRTGGDVPLVDLVLAPYRFNDAVWRIYAANSMVRVEKHCVVCLGILDGGAMANTGIVIGGHQLEDNLLEFDLVNSRLGFSSTLLLHNTRCSHLKVA